MPLTPIEENAGYYEFNFESDTAAPSNAEQLNKQLIIVVPPPSAYQLFKNGLYKLFDTVKFIVDSFDDIIILIKEALKSTKKAFVIAAEVTVGSVFGLIAGFEGYKANNKINKLKKQRDRLEAAITLKSYLIDNMSEDKAHNEAEREKREQSLNLFMDEENTTKKRINIHRESLLWCATAGGIGATIIITGGIGISILGAPLLPGLSMLALVRKYYNDYRDLGLQIELITLKKSKDSQLTPALIEQYNSKLQKLRTKQKFKLAEITAASFITISLLIGGIVALGFISIGSFGIVPTALLATGAAIGIISKVKEMYDEKETPHDKKIFLAKVVTLPVWLPFAIAATPFYGLYKLVKAIKQSLTSEKLMIEVTVSNTDPHTAIEKIEPYLGPQVSAVTNSEFIVKKLNQTIKASEDKESKQILKPKEQKSALALKNVDATNIYHRLFHKKPEPYLHCANSSAHPEKETRISIVC